MRWQRQEYRGEKQVLRQRHGKAGEGVRRFLSALSLALLSSLSEASIKGI